jgi:hypothetical protein
VPSPPIEWVAGDPIWARRFKLIELLSIAVCALIPILILQSAFVNISAGANYLDGLGVIAIFVVPACGALATIPAWLLPRRRPVVRRLGISPLQLRVEYSFRNLDVAWQDVRWLDPFRIEISRKLGSMQFLLTNDQASRIRSFFQYGQPLPSSVPMGKSRVATPVIR